MQPRIPFAFLVARAHCFLVLNMVPTRTHRSFSRKLLSGWLAPIMHWFLGLFLPRCRTLHFLFNFMTFLLAHFFNLSKSLWRGAWPLGISVIPPSFVLSASLLRETLFLMIQIINEDVDQILIQYWCLGYTASFWSLSRLCSYWSPPFGLSAHPAHVY